MLSINGEIAMLVFYILTALLFSFFCSIAEAVFLSVSSPFIAALEKRGKRSGRTLRKLKENVNRPLAAILTLNTIAHTIGAAGAGAEAARIFGSQYLGLASAILTLLILIFSEIIPKTLGARYWRNLAGPMAPLLRWLVWILFPFVILSEALTRGIAHTTELKGLSREELAAMADLGAQEGQLEAKESRILKNLFRFRSTNIRNIMTPRTVVFAQQENMTVEDFMEHHHQTPFSRIPIYNLDRDDITGFVLKDDILMAQARDLRTARLHELKREIKAVAPDSSVSELFEFLLDNKEHIALVMDEYGGMEGIVTLEDVVETLLGLEIVDEADETVDMQALARALWEKRARKVGLLTEDTSIDHPGRALPDHDLVPSDAEDLPRAAEADADQDAAEEAPPETDS